jgi:tetratricopeptide (TPR) repeat protein
MRRRFVQSMLGMAGLIAFVAGCDGSDAPARVEPTPLALVLAPHTGDGPLDREIRSRQQRLASSPEPLPHLDRLGWLFVAKARRESDPGYYHLAERCAAAMAEIVEYGPEAQLLRGHALHGLHRFAEAEREARALVKARGLAFDHGLLGDVLLDRGDLAGAIDAYQRMADLRPDSHALARAAQVRFLTGDVEGAANAMASAARATSPRNPETFAWVWSRLSLYQLQLGSPDAALHSVEVALARDPQAAAALFARGRILLARGASEAAIAPLREAAQRNPLPEALWTLAEALHLAGQLEEEEAVRTRLLDSGHATDPRGFSIYLASHGIDTARALALAHAELRARRDVHTWDALAWAQAAQGQLAAARESIAHALAAGTRDARFFLHAGLIAAADDAPDEAARWLAEADALRHTLLPSERARLDAQLGSTRATTESS